MTDDLRVDKRCENGVPVLTIDYGTEQMFQARVSELLSERLVNAYRTLLSESHEHEPARACIVVIKAETAGSPLVRALFDLYKVVHAGSGTLICVSYPKAYMDSLTSIGLTVLPGFFLAETEDEAFRKAVTSSTVN